eukprot:141164-Alexandrium_andersonii.AAC.1
MTIGAPKAEVEGDSTPLRTISSKSLNAAACCSGVRGRAGMLGGGLLPDLYSSVKSNLNSVAIPRP